MLYGTTAEFLKCFCLSSLSELPELPEKETTPVNAVQSQQYEPDKTEISGSEQPLIDESAAESEDDDFDFDDFDVDADELNGMYE